MNRICVATASILVLFSLINGQTSFTSNQKISKPVQSKADPEREQRRAIAISSLQALAIEARSYRDEPLRARVQARIADVLWNVDQQGARALFRRAWEIAEVVDQTRGSNVPGRRPTNNRAPVRANLRREILQLASRRDHKLGEEFLAKLTPADANQTIATSERSSAESVERIRLANEFLEAGNTGRALQFADPALRRINQGTIQFLVTLRDKNAAAADQRFASLLSIANADPASDANTVSLLTSYTFTPSVYLMVSPGGIPSSFSYQPRPAPALAPALRRNFFEVAAQILLRPLSQIDVSSAGRPGTKVITTRLMPLFQQFAPDLAPALHAQLAAMGTEATKVYPVPNIDLNRDRDQLPIDDELKARLDRAQGIDERDRIYASAAMRAADKADPRARELADKIEDSDTRKGVTTFVDYSFIGSLIRNKQPNEALVLIRKSNLTHTLRAHYLMQVAALMVKEDRVRASELFEEAVAETRRIDAGTSERAYSFIAILRHFSIFNRQRMWEVLSETVKAANSVSDFTGENGMTPITLEGKFGIRMVTELASPADLAEVFEILAGENFYQAIDASKTFTGDAPRAIATIAIAKAVLEEKPPKSR